jgi:hypothetical protein
VGEGDPGGAGGAEAGGESASAQPSSAAASGADATPGLVHPRQSPLYHAQHSDRYQRQRLIEAYEDATGCKFVAAIDFIDIDFVQNIEEHLYQEDGSREVHVLLRSPGGDGEMALRAVRAMQARASKLVLLIPDIAKSAATLLAVGADEIRLGPTSDLGPIDPQMQIGGPSGSWYSAKAIMSAVHQAEKAVSEDRSLTPLWASLLAQVTALDYQAAKAELDRTETMVRQALGYRTQPPAAEDLEDRVAKLITGLQDTPTSHGATLGPRELNAMDLPVVELDPCSWEWECIWRLWTFYWVQIAGPIYESRHGSFRPGGPHPA